MEGNAPSAEKTAFRILLAISFCHLLNDLVQSLLPSIYPLLKTSFGLTFAQLGLVTLTFQLTASVFQPFIGQYTDRRPQPYSLPAGVGFTLAGLLTLSAASTFPLLILGAALVGLGSAVFHPESSRVARLASGGRHGLAQSIFHLGGTFGGALGPLLAAAIVVRHGQSSLAWFSITALLAVVILLQVAHWYRHQRGRAKPTASSALATPPLSRTTVGLSLGILMALVFSKYFYLTSLTSYYTFYLISKFGISIRAAQLYLFLFLASAAAGVFVGGPIGDRMGRKVVIWVSILGILPFTLVLPYVGLFATALLTVVIGFVLSSAFSAIVVYAQELVPGRIGMISGLFFGLAFGMAGIGAALLGMLADRTSIGFVYKVCAYLPAVGLLTIFLPDIDSPRARRSQVEVVTAASR